MEVAKNPINIQIRRRKNLIKRIEKGKKCGRYNVLINIYLALFGGHFFIYLKSFFRTPGQSIVEQCLDDRLSRL